jgi:hypothetical protein
MGFRDKDGNPLPSWTDAETAFEAWKKCSSGRPCDYTGLAYGRWRASGGVQWSCNDEHPEGTERLYADGRVLGAAGLLRVLRQGSAHGRTAGTDRVPLAESDGQDRHQSGGIRPAP